MKKVILVLLTVALVLSCCACGKPKETEPEKPATRTIILTKENFTTYFYIEHSLAEYEEVEKNLLDPSLIRVTSDCTISISQKNVGNLSNVSVTLRITVYGSFWTSDDESAKEITINVPVGGSAQKTVTLESDWGTKSLLDLPNISVAVVGVTGTIEMD